MRRPILTAAAVAAVFASGAAGFGIATLTEGDTPQAAAALTPSVFVAQAAAGTGSGSSCTNARALTYFNSAVTAGTTVGLCGTITSQLVLRGSGTAAAPITILFQPGARLSESVCPSSGCLNLNGTNYVTVDGGGTGVIEATANGSALASHNDNTLGVYLANCSGCVFRNLTVQNIYQRTNPEDYAAGGNGIQIVDGNNVTLDHLTVHDTGWAIYQRYTSSGQGQNFTLSNSDLSRSDHDVALTFGCAGCSTGPFIYRSNHLHDFGNWDSSQNAYHHDGIHCFTSGTNGAPAHINGLYWYDNLTDGDGFTNHMTSPVFLESGASGTPCADATSDIWLFNNVSIGNGVNNGMMVLTSGRPHAFNNTFIGLNGDAVGVESNQKVVGEEMKNNVTSNFDQLVVVANTTFAAGSPDYNVWAAGGGNAFVCNGNYLSFASFAAWKSCVAGDAHAVAVSSAKLNANGSPQAGSPVIGAGTNLSSLCVGNLAPLCTDIAGAARPSSGPWDAGAYQTGTAPPVTTTVVTTTTAPTTTVTTTTAPTTTTTPTTTAPPPPVPLATVTLSLHSGTYRVYGYSSTGKIIASFTGSSRTTAVSWQTTWTARIP